MLSTAVSSAATFATSGLLFLSATPELGNDVSFQGIAIAAAFAIVAWQMRRMISQSERQTEELITLRLTLTGDGKSTKGMAGNVDALDAKIERVARRQEEIQENRQDLMLDWVTWRQKVDMTLTRLTDGEYHPDARAGSPGRRHTDFVGPARQERGE